MSTNDLHLYRPSASKPTRPSKTNPTDTAFASAFSSLLAGAPTERLAKPRYVISKNGTSGRPNGRKRKRSVAERHAPRPTTAKREGGEAEPIDDAEWRLTRRKLDEKARLYAALKRGDVDDRDEKYGVDFDRKWAERDDKGTDSEQVNSEDADEDNNEMVEYVDDLGRTRTGTCTEMLLEQRRRSRQTHAEEAGASDSVRPSAPRNVIHGDAIQSEAFDPDVAIASRMSELAGKRDKAETPPPDEHYNASKEVRTKGTGFYQFSQDAEERKRQLKELEELRAETEKARGEQHSKRESDKQKRDMDMVERRKRIREKKGRVMADRFLEGLGEEMMKMSRGTGEDAAQEARVGGA